MLGQKSTSIKKMLLHTDGQTLMEYAVIIMFIVIVAIISLTLFGNRVLALYQQVVGAF